MAISLAGGADTAHWTSPSNRPFQGTVAFWMNSSSATANEALLTFWNSSSRQGWGLIVNNPSTGRIVAAGYSGTAQQASISSASTVNDGTWRHVAYSWDHSTAAVSATNGNKLFIDGALDASAASSGLWGGNGSGQFLQSGDNADAFWPSYVGKLAELGLWWGAHLTTDEIAALAKGFSPRAIRPALRQFYAPLVRDTHDVRGGWTFGSVGGSVADHPRMVGGAV